MNTTTDKTAEQVADQPSASGAACAACKAMLPEQALFCDACGTPVEAGTDATAQPVSVALLPPAAVADAAPPAMPVSEAADLAPAAPAIDPDAPLLPGAQALDKVRELVRDKTRFEPEDLQPLSAGEELEPCRVEVRYALEARLVERSISGHFQAGQADRKVAQRFAVVGEALDGGDERRQLAAAGLGRQLAKPDTGYDAIGDGVYLRHATRYWHLDTCSPCSGGGRVTCTGCYGRGEQTCYNCQGAQRVRCTDWGCSGGRKNCSSCSGSGQTSSTEYYQEPVQVSATVYYNGESRTEYRTEYQSRSRTVYSTCYQCSGGTVTCNTCHGSSMVNCGTCFARGVLTCSGCGGGGKVSCTPCEGSGQEGVAAWVDVHASVASELLLPQTASDELRRIGAREQVAGMMEQAHSVAPPQIRTSAGGANVHADYSLQLQVVRLALACGDQEYATVAYGRALRWLTLDDIVEDLLQHDLRALTEALVRLADEGLFAAGVDGLLQPLHAVAASELNAEVIESVLDGQPARAHADVVSERYASDLHSSVLGALRQVHTRVAKRTWWQGALALAGVALPLWLFQGKWWALAAGVGVAAATIPAYQWRLRKLLSQALGGPVQGARAMALAAKGKRDRLAHALVLAPCVLLLAGLAYSLPQHGWLQSGVAQQAAAPATQASAAERAAVAPVIALHAAGKLAAARTQIEALAQGGNPAASGLYGWMLLVGDGLDKDALSRTSLAERLEQSRPWIERGLALDDGWAQTARGVTLLNAANGKPDAARGLALLEQAANGGNALAAHLLGSLYQEGRSVTRDYAAARKWYALAVQHGHAASFYPLGVLEWNGAGGVAPERSKALQYWRQGAALGDAMAVKAAARGRPMP